jgi:signal transduction histidine kinase
VSPPPLSELPDLLALLAHDLRNPLSALLTNINFVRSTVKPGTSEVDEALSDSALSCAILGFFIGNLDVLSRSLADSQTARRPTLARQAASEAALRLGPQAALLGVEVEIVPGPHAPRLLVDPSFFGRALDNLVANALQYSPHKGKVRIECSARKERGVLTVVDDGPSVPSDLREVALTAQGQNVAKQTYEARYGRGLGLYCAAEAARISGAEVTICERSGRSALEISAPLAP